MLSFDDALHALREAMEPLPAQRVPFAQALGRILAQAVHSPAALPRFDNSAMDGFAVCAHTVGRRARVAFEVAAGQMPAQALAPQEAARIFTGARLPEGADCVVPQEHVQVEGEAVVLPEGLAAGQHVRMAGEDIAQGQRVLEAGTRIGPGAMAVLAACGIAHISAFRQPRVALLSTGNELCPPLGAEAAPGYAGSGAGEPGSGAGEPGGGGGEPGRGSGEPGRGGGEPGSGTWEPGRGGGEPGRGTWEPGGGSGENPAGAGANTANTGNTASAALPGASLFDSNTPMLAAWARSLGAQVRCAHLPDDKRLTRQRLEALLPDADVLVTIGGISIGRYDFIGPVLKEMGCRFLISKIAMKPGKPLCLGRLDGRYVLGLPGNPGAAFVGAFFFLAPLLRGLQGAREAFAQPVQATLSHEARVSGERVQIHCAQVAWAQGQARVRLFSPFSSGALLPLGLCNALVPLKKPHYAAGERLEVFGLW